MLRSGMPKVRVALSEAVEGSPDLLDESSSYFRYSPKRGVSSPGEELKEGICQVCLSSGVIEIVSIVSFMFWNSRFALIVRLKYAPTTKTKHTETKHNNRS